MPPTKVRLIPMRFDPEFVARMDAYVKANDPAITSRTHLVMLAVTEYMKKQKRPRKSAKTKGLNIQQVMTLRMLAGTVQDGTRTEEEFLQMVRTVAHQEAPEGSFYMLRNSGRGNNAERKVNAVSVFISNMLKPS